MRRGLREPEAGEPPGTAERDEQYQKTGVLGEDFIITENGIPFWVNLDKYLDTGLFLDHRNTRLRIKNEAKGKRFLNLFAYTGSFTVYAAKGGAIYSETVDLSNAYTEWAKKNFKLNNINIRIYTTNAKTI